MSGFIQYWNAGIGKALGETLIMVLNSTILSVIFGGIMGVILILTKSGGLKENKVVYNILNFFVNIFRSFPFIVLVLFLMPLTIIIMRFFTGVGTSTGNTAVLVPLTVGAAPFIARIVENALQEVPYGMIEASKALGLSTTQIIFKVMIVEAIPALVSGLTLSVVSIIGFTALAGAVGAGGLGALALTKGMFDYTLLVWTTLVLILVVQLTQLLGNIIYKLIK